MIELILQWFDGLMKIVNTAPIQLWALVLGLLMSWGVTQRAKFLIPPMKNQERRNYIAQAMAFVVGFATTWALWPDRYGFVCALIIGLFSPLTYKLFMTWLAKRFPRTRRVLSLDYPDGAEEKPQPQKQVVVAQVAVVPAPTEEKDTL